MTEHSIRIPADFVARLAKSIKRNPSANPGRPYLQAWCETCDWMSMATVNRATMLTQIQAHRYQVAVTAP